MIIIMSSPLCFIGSWTIQCHYHNITFIYVSFVIWACHFHFVSLIVPFMVISVKSGLFQWSYHSWSSVSSLVCFIYRPSHDHQCQVWCVSLVVPLITIIMVSGTTLIHWLLPSWWRCSSVDIASDWHIADAGSIPQCSKGFFSHSQLSVQTLLQCLYTPLCNSMH